MTTPGRGHRNALRRGFEEPRGIAVVPGMRGRSVAAGCDGDIQLPGQDGTRGPWRPPQRARVRCGSPGMGSAASPTFLSIPAVSLAPSALLPGSKLGPRPSWPGQSSLSSQDPVRWSMAKQGPVRRCRSVPRAGASRAR
jgi:hypothetical protein